MKQPSREHDVFISYSSADEAWAKAALGALERLGLRCWIAPRDILAGETWAGAIVRAIHGCRLMVLVFSRHSNESPQVTRELVQAAERGVHVLPLRVDEVQPSNDMAYYLGAAHWRTVLGGPTPANLAQLEDDVRRLLDVRAAPAASAPPDSGARNAEDAAKPRMQRRIVLAAPVIAGLALAVWFAPRLFTAPAGGGSVGAAPPRNDSSEQGGGGASSAVPAATLAATGSPLEPLTHAGAGQGVVEESKGDEPPPAPELDLWATAPDALRERFESLGKDTTWKEAGGLSLPATIRHKGTGIVFVLVPGGRVVLGSEPVSQDVDHDEHPVREVELSPFYIARYETTGAQWRGDASSSSTPMVQVTYDQAAEWCAARGLALPTEAQWEYAASGPENRTYPWGDAWTSGRCNSIGEGDGHRELAPVGSFQSGASWCGAEDLAGNAAEWCRGFHCQALAELAGDVDPLPPARGSQRVVRGGSWFDRARNMRSSDRRPYGLSAANGYVGFRCVFEL